MCPELQRMIAEGEAPHDREHRCADWRPVDLELPEWTGWQDLGGNAQYLLQLRAALKACNTKPPLATPPPATPRVSQPTPRPSLFRTLVPESSKRPGLELTVQRPPLTQKPATAAQAAPQPAAPKVEPPPRARRSSRPRVPRQGGASERKHERATDRTDASPALAKKAHSLADQPASACAADCGGAHPTGTSTPGLFCASPFQDASLWAVSSQAAEAGESQVTLIRSVFEGRPPVLLFRSSLAGGGPQGRRVLTGADLDGGAVCPAKMYYCHTRETHEYNAVLKTLQASGLHRTGLRSAKWCLCWGGVPKPDALRSFNPFQVVNHFPGSWQAGRKDLLWRNVQRLQRRAPQQVEIAPSSFILPEDMRCWELAREQQPAALWIWKPVNGSCGRGVRLLRSPLDAATERSLAQKKGIVSRYVHRPLLLDGYKFDLRLYVVVTSYDPLRAYLSSEGLVRLATEKYSLSPQLLDHRTMHLTNYSVNKHATAYVKNLDAPDGQTAPSSAGDRRRPGSISPGSGSAGRASAVIASEEAEEAEECGGVLSDGELDEGGAETCSDEEPPEKEDSREHWLSSKWSLQQLREHFAARGLDYGLMMERIKDLLVKTLIAVEPPIASLCHQGANFQGRAGAQALRGLGPNQSCFEIYGFDVLMDENLAPWLLEVNILPSLSSSSPLDKRIKTQLIAETLTLVGIRPFDHRLVSQALREERESQVCGLQPKLQGLPKSHTIQSLASCSLSDLGQAEWATILDAHDEFMRRGSMERIFPAEDPEEKYCGLFESARYANLVLAKWLKEGGERIFHPDFAHLLPAWVPRVVSCEPC